MSTNVLGGRKVSEDVFRTYKELAEGTGLGEEWLRRNLRVKISLDHFQPQPGSPDALVSQKAFEAWLEDVKLVPFRQMGLFLGLSTGQCSRVTTSKKIKPLVPSTDGGKNYVPKEKVLEYAEAVKTSRWGLCGKPEAEPEPAVVIFRPKHSRRTWTTWRAVRRSSSW